MSDVPSLWLALLCRLISVTLQACRSCFSAACKLSSWFFNTSIRVFLTSWTWSRISFFRFKNAIIWKSNIKSTSLRIFLAFNVTSAAIAWTLGIPRSISRTNALACRTRASSSALHLKIAPSSSRCVCPWCPPPLQLLQMGRSQVSQNKVSICWECRGQSSGLLKARSDCFCKSSNGTWVWAFELRAFLWASLCKSQRYCAHSLHRQMAAEGSASSQISHLILRLPCNTWIISSTLYSKLSTGRLSTSLLDLISSVHSQQTGQLKWPLSWVSMQLLQREWRQGNMRGSCRIPLHMGQNKLTPTPVSQGPAVAMASSMLSRLVSCSSTDSFLPTVIQHE